MALKVTPREIALLVGDKEYFLSPTFNAILDIESRSGKGINVILAAILGMSFSFTDLVTIVWAGIRANYRVNKKDLKGVPAWEDLAQEIQAVGYTNILSNLIEFLTNLVNGTSAIEQESKDVTDSQGEPEKN